MVFFTIITVGIFALFIPKKITVFKISHTHLLDIKLQGLSCFTGNVLKELLINLAFIAKPYLLQQTNNKKLLQIKDGLSC